ncbi:cytochrome c oxidase, cbb3-type, CcoQ subunit [Campylobacter curvus]|uniref:cytochrome c oxidase, cbb3-type, CcoQ subunit n=1 Tax=Campylobacter curvus TaxID=200 RepID=UPI00146FDAB1|nr:cytochrome c oxidase, cbb3-type, CcoQ subunit [Campylobacter curvus]
MDNIRDFQAYGYFFFTVFLVLVLYGYFYHLYKSERTGRRDYERYSNLALNDEVESEILERNSDEKGR